MEWFTKVADAKFFAWVHYFDPHVPYLPPEPLRTQYASHPYEGEIAYVDREIGALLASLEQLGLLNNTLIVLASDHGEGLGEHGENTHSLLVYDATLHTPLIFYFPKQDPLGKVVQREVSNVDIVPTVLDLLGIQSDVQFDGASLVRGPQAHDDTIYGETIATLVLHGWSPLFTARQQETKYIHAPRPELYDLKRDPKELNNIIGERPEQAAALSRRLKEYIGNDLFGAEAMKQMVTMDPETTRKLAALGYVSTQAQATIDVQAAAQRDPKDMIAHLERVYAAEHLRIMGKFQEALKELQACIKVVPDDVLALQLLSSAYLDMGDLDRAEKSCQRVLELQPKEMDTYMTLGNIDLDRGRPKDAEKHFNQALAVDPGFATAYVGLGTLYAQTEGMEKALEYYHKAIEMDPGSAGLDAYNAIGGEYLARMELDKAREAFEKAIEINQLDGRAHSGLARVFIAEGKMEEAQAELKIAVRYNPNDRRVLEALSALHNEKGEYDKALTLARRVASANDADPRSLNNLGSALRNTGDLAGAKEVFEKALARNPRYVPCVINLAQVYLDERREEKAVELYQRALEINPRQPKALLNLGTYENLHGHRDKALVFYRRAVKADPNYALARLQLGMVLMELGQAAEAIPHLKRSLELDPDQPSRERLRKMLESLGEKPTN